MVDLAAPESQAGRLIEDARKQIKTRRLTTPIGDNAYDSLLQAAAADAEHLELGPAAAELVGALGQEAALRLQRDDTPGAVDALTKATRMGALVAPAAATQLAGTRRAMARAIEVRIAAAAHRFDRDAARAAFAVAGSIRLDPASRERLAAQIDAIPAVGQAVPGDPGGMTVQRAGDGAYALTRRLISREEYARFAEATGREPALCRERASLLRMLSPRDWTSPGFDQQADDAVVCVAWDDADAFARWLGRQNGGNYRLPAAGEAGLLAAAPGGRKLSEWLLDCSDDCQTRAVSGDSWRRGGSPARAGGRGYDDVGFRLVREP